MIPAKSDIISVALVQKGTPDACQCWFPSLASAVGSSEQHQHQHQQQAARCLFCEGIRSPQPPTKAFESKEGMSGWRAPIFVVQEEAEAPSRFDDEDPSIPPPLLSHSPDSQARKRRSSRSPDLALRYTPANLRHTPGKREGRSHDRSCPARGADIGRTVSPFLENLAMLQPWNGLTFRSFYLSTRTRDLLVLRHTGLSDRSDYQHEQGSFLDKTAVLQSGHLDGPPRQPNCVVTQK